MAYVTVCDQSYCQARTVTEAFAIAADGDTIQVAPGIYDEAPMDLRGRNLRIIGDSTELPVLVANATGPMFSADPGSTLTLMYVVLARKDR